MFQLLTVSGVWGFLDICFWPVVHRDWQNQRLASSRSHFPQKTPAVDLNGDWEPVHKEKVWVITCAWFRMIYGSILLTAYMPALVTVDDRLCSCTHNHLQWNGYQVYKVPALQLTLLGHKCPQFNVLTSLQLYWNINTPNSKYYKYIAYLCWDINAPM